MLALVIVLYSLGGLLPILGLLGAWRAARRAFAALDGDLREIERISQTSKGDIEETRRAMYAVRRPTSTYTHALYQHENIQRAILRSALDDLGGPALLAGIGVAFATAGSLCSLAL